MKIIIPLVASLFLAAMTFAQEESPAPAESTAPATEEKPSASVETAPEAPAVEAAAPAQKKEEATIAASMAPVKAAAPKKETAAPAAGAAAAKPASATKTASAAAAPAAKMAPKAMNPRDAENAWEASVAKHDYSTVEAYVASDFTGVSSKNKFVNRSQMLSEFKGDKDTYKSAKNEKLNVQMYGSNVAVVTGRAHETGTGKDGKAFDRTYLFTDTWMMRSGKWQCVASHNTKIKG